MSALAFDGSANKTPVGYFTYTVKEDHWSWSDGVYELHGYAPQAVLATTELMLKHKHPDDMARSFEVLENVVKDGQPFSCYHRIIDAKERVRSVISVGRGVLGHDGNVEQVTGFFVDLTEVHRTQTQVGVDEALLRIAETRSAIEQAKGILMVAAGCDADEAFGLLRTYSSHKNVKLNDLARRLVEAISAQALPDDHSCRTAVMAVLDNIKAFSRPESR